MLSHLVWIDTLNQVTAAADDMLPQTFPLDRRMEIILDANWTGALLPYLEKRTIYARAEALLSFGYYLSAEYHAKKGHNAHAPEIQARWWFDLEADRTLFQTMKDLIFKYSRAVSAGSQDPPEPGITISNELRMALVNFDTQEKRGSMLTNKADEVFQSIIDDVHRLAGSAR